MALLHLIWGSLARTLRSGRGSADRAAVFEHVDSRLLDGGGFRASESIGLDGAPSMAFHDAMPPYAPDIDQPSVRCG
jgi:hypothetical protein